MTDTMRARLSKLLVQIGVDGMSCLVSTPSGEEELPQKLWDRCLKD